MRGKSRMAEIARRQCGVVTRKQLLALSVNRRDIDRMIAAKQLHPLHRGVYLVGHPVAPPGAREMAATLACGPQAFVSHRDAAVIHKLLPYPADPGPVHVTVARDCGRRPGIAVHRVAELRPDEVGRLDGIPVTSPARTLIDLAAMGSAEVEQAWAEAEHRGLVDRGEMLARSIGRPGAKLLRRVLNAGPALTRSEAERKLLQLIRAAALPSPAANARLNGFEVDFLWPGPRLVVEVDGFAFHGNRGAFERDRVRDATLIAAGYAVIRVTWRQLGDRPEAVVARIAAALASR
jgi:very-short-patch-repair endonuclease